MFTIIFGFEVKRWFKTWLFYLYLLVFFVMGFLIMASAAGVFDKASATRASLRIVNSPYALNGFLDGFKELLYFLLPSIVGMSIYRDYKYDMHYLLYSYPLKKIPYLAAKFTSGFFITILISLAVGLGLFIATLLPWANEKLIGPNYFWSYAQVYLFNLVPNLLLIGSIVFALVTLTRSIYVGFISIIVVLIWQGVSSSIGRDIENLEISALLDPSGWRAIMYYTRHWTIEQYNFMDLPLEKYYFLNRLILLSLALLFLLTLAKMFNFSQQGFMLFKNKKGQVLTKDNFITLSRIELPKANFDFGLKQHISNVIYFAWIDFKYLARNKAFLILMACGIGLMLATVSFSGLMFGTTTYPVTRLMLALPVSVFLFFIFLITFLSAGMLLNRGRLTRMNLLIEVTPTPNWVMFISKFFALTILQISMLLLCIVTVISYQLWQGYTNIEIDLYLKHVFGFTLVGFILWSLISFFIQGLVKNYIVGFFILLILSMLWPEISRIGIEQPMFNISSITTPSYSDMNGFGSGIFKFYTHAFYWFLFCLILSIGTVLFYRRGVVFGVKERFYFAKKRVSKNIAFVLATCALAFLSLGSYLYYENTMLNPYYSAKEIELMRVENEKKYSIYKHLPIPKVVDISLEVELYPETQDFEVNGEYSIVNKSDKPIDSLFVNFQPDFVNVYEFLDNVTQEVFKDTVTGAGLYVFEKSLQPRDTLHMVFRTKNKPNTSLRAHSPILANGTFINDGIFPSFGYRESSEIVQNDIREKYGLAPKERMAKQDNQEKLQQTYIAIDGDWITFKAKIGTSENQIALAPGYLQNEYVENGRRYFEYAMPQKMLKFYTIASGEYQVKKELYDGIAIEIYYHQDHSYNIDRMIESVKHSLDYYQKNFSPYQFDQVRILEFPSTHGSFAQSFANTIPFSEEIGFIAKVDDSNSNAVDYPYSVTAHEMAHQWWAHQVIGADVQGMTMLSESLSEYSSLKVLEQKYGKGQMRRYLMNSLDSYLRGRGAESKKELPLMYNEGQQYIHYNKGSLVFYAVSDYLGDEVFNGILKDYIAKVGFQEAPFTTTKDLVEMIKLKTPDSLQYIVTDMFETITLYNNSISDVKVTPVDNGKFEVDITALVTKYRSGEKGEKIFESDTATPLSFTSDKGGEMQSLPLADYIEIGVFAKQEESKLANPFEDKLKILYLEKVKITQIENKFSIIVDEEPIEVGIDPFYKLIDARSFDNRKSI